MCIHYTEFFLFSGVVQCSIVICNSSTNLNICYHSSSQSNLHFRGGIAFSSMLSFKTGSTSQYSWKLWLLTQNEFPGPSYLKTDAHSMSVPSDNSFINKTKQSQPFKVSLLTIQGITGMTVSMSQCINSGCRRKFFSEKFPCKSFCLGDWFDSCILTFFSRQDSLEWNTWDNKSSVKALALHGIFCNRK